jgi:hypothetical protein
MENGEVRLEGDPWFVCKHCNAYCDLAAEESEFPEPSGVLVVWERTGATITDDEIARIRDEAPVNAAHRDLYITCVRALGVDIRTGFVVSETERMVAREAVADAWNLRHRSGDVPGYPARVDALFDSPLVRDFTARDFADLCVAAADQAGLDERRQRSLAQMLNVVLTSKGGGE